MTPPKDSACSAHMQLAIDVARLEEQHDATSATVSRIEGKIDKIDAKLEQMAGRGEVQVERVKARGAVELAKTAGVFGLLTIMLETVKAWFSK